MDILWYVLWFLVAVSLLVTVHEYGHYWVARQLGFKVLRFSVGFGRPLFSKVAGPDRTEYVFAAIPLGGYVKLLDEREGPVATAELERSFTRKPPWQRILVLLAGPAFNIAFAILLLWTAAAAAAAGDALCTALQSLLPVPWPSCALCDRACHPACVGCAQQLDRGQAAGAQRQQAPQEQV